ncbi:MAG: Ig-like domain-containing protein [Anaeromyxobacteraceae bacterium]
MIRLTRLTRLATAAGALAFAAPALANLLDHGPQDPSLTFPTWYRDTASVPLQLCRTQTVSPNAAAGLGPMCFPLAADPAGFAGNVGPEVFYADMTAQIGGRGANAGFSAFYQAALEASYLTAAPTHGSETVFARIRVVINVVTPGTYKVTHPYGVDIFPDVQAGPRAVFFTDDVTPIPGNFDAALPSRIGPWLQWDFLSPGESLTTTSAAGAAEQFIGDPNYTHTYTGSPFNTNYVRVDGPPGSNLDGVGNDFIQTPLASILGQKYLAPIPTPLRVTRATYTRDPAANLNAVDVFATSAPTARLLVTGADLPSLAMKGDGLGNFWAHVEYPATIPLPAGIAVTNVNDAPPTTVTAALADVVTITSATFDTLTNALRVTATSSDLSVPPPALAVSGPLGGAMTAGAYAKTLAATALPPTHVTVISAAAGSTTTDLVIVPGLPMNPALRPIAVADAVTVPQNGSATVDLGANDALVAPATLASVVVTQAPAHGSVAVVAATPGAVTYTPAAAYAGPDSFQYVVQDSAGTVSNVATVNVTVSFVASPPVANADSWAQVKGTTRTVNVLANDQAAVGTSLVASSVAVATPPLHGAATANADGTITYAPVAGYVGADGFTYTVANNVGQRSNAAAATVTVTGSVETLAVSKATWRASTGKWTIIGTTNVFGAQLTSTATCYVGRGTAGPLIGSAPIDGTGKFQLVPPTAPPPDATNLFTCVSTNGGSITAVVQRN